MTEVFRDERGNEYRKFDSMWGLYDKGRWLWDESGLTPLGEVQNAKAGKYEVGGISLTVRWRRKWSKETIKQYPQWDNEKENPVVMKLRIDKGPLCGDLNNREPGLEDGDTSGYAHRVLVRVGKSLRVYRAEDVSVALWRAREEWRRQHPPLTIRDLRPPLQAVSAGSRPDGNVSMSFCCGPFYEHQCKGKSALALALALCFFAWMDGEKIGKEWKLTKKTPHGFKHSPGLCGCFA